MANAQILRDLMAEYGLTRQKTADLLDVSKACIDNWLRPEHNKCFRPMPDREIAFLKCLLRPKKKRPR